MDVLKEIAQAEGRAKEIEQEFKKKAEALAEAAKGRLTSSRADSEAALEKEISGLRAELDRRLEQEKAKVTAAGRQAQEKLERQVRENSSRAIEIILKKIGL
jgi:vacuolar-type H+-ATPase subunit H